MNRDEIARFQGAAGLEVTGNINRATRQLAMTLNPEKIREMGRDFSLAYVEWAKEWGHPYLPPGPPPSGGSGSALSREAKTPLSAAMRPTAEQALEAILASVRESDDSFKAAGEWITRVTNGITEVLKEIDDQ